MTPLLGVGDILGCIRGGGGRKGGLCEIIPPSEITKHRPLVSVTGFGKCPTLKPTDVNVATLLLHT